MVVNPCSSAGRQAKVARAARSAMPAFKIFSPSPPFAGSSPQRKMWVCESIRPGSTVAAERSITAASAGICVAPSATLSMRLPRTKISLFFRGELLEPSIREPARITVTCVAGDAVDCGRTADAQKVSDKIAKTIFFFMESGLDAHSLPEGDAILDFGGGGFGVRIIPGGVFVFHAIDFEMVVVRGALPGAFASVRARPEEFLLHRFGGEILVPFDDDGAIAVRDDFSCPGCFRH